MLRTALTVFFAAVLLIAAFAFFIPHANNGAEEASLPAESTPVTPNITLSDVYKKGIRTFSGSVEAPTPCTEVVVHGEISSSTPERITISILMPPDTSICLQQITKVPFKVTLPATVAAVVEVLVNGRQASTTARQP